MRRALELLASLTPTRARAAIVAIICQPLIVKAALLLGFVNSDPLTKHSGLGSPTYVGFRGATSLDTNIAYTSHALGTYAARTLAQGGSLWWNPFEGVGTPLAGEMQSAALFPPTWLMLLPNGQLIEHLLFQIVAGIATYLLARRLGLSVLASWFAGTAFSFNGTFAWLANAIINPICFMPVILLGVELVRSSIVRERRIGGLCIAIGIAGSLYAGFPEVAYLDGVMIAGWTLVRSIVFLPDRHRTAGFLLRAGLAASCGCLLAAPLLTAFVDFLNVSNVGVHDGPGVENPIRFVDFAMMLVPYLPGAITYHPPLFWGNIGGYVGVALAVLALAGVAARLYRPLRLYLLGWTIISLGVIYNVPPVPALVAMIPGMRSVVLFRYIEPSLFLAVIVLAALLLDDMATGRITLGTVRRSLIGTIVVAVIASIVAIANGIFPLEKIEYGPLLAHLVFIGLFAAVILVKVVSAETRLRLMALSGAIEIAALFAMPMISYPLDRKVELGGVAFLQRHLGTQRFVSTGPISLPGSIAANYGTFFGIAQVNWNDLPVPQRWVDYVHRHIDRNADAIVFRVSPEQFRASLSAYAAIGTKYVTVPKDHVLPGLRQVNVDSLMRIYEIPDYRRYFFAPGCAVTWSSRNSATTRCPRASRLERLELSMPGWTAMTDGASRPVGRAREIFQAVAVPAGTSTTQFRFRPPSLWLGQLLAVIGIIGLAALFLADGRWAARKPHVSPAAA